MATSSLLPKINDIICYNGDTETSVIIFWKVPVITNPAIIIDGYKVQRRELGDSSWTTLGNTTLNKFEDNTLEFGKTYEFRVSVLYPEGTISLL